MVSVRFLGLISTVLLLVGALLVGEAIHVTFVTGQVAVTSPSFFAPLVIGSVLLLLGYRARAPVAEAYDLTSDGDEEPSKPRPDAPRADEAEDEFDPGMSPLGDAEPRTTDRDDDH
jgi:hypothetical protein